MGNKENKELNSSCHPGLDPGKEKKEICKKGQLMGQ